MILPVILSHGPEVILRLIAPAALPEAERKFRRDIAAADDLPELLYDVISGFPFNDIQGQIGIFTGDAHRILAGITDVKGQFPRIVEEEAEGLFPGNDNEVVCSVEGMLVFRVVRIIGTVACIAPAPLVDAAVGFAQTVDDIIFIHSICK